MQTGAIGAQHAMCVGKLLKTELAKGLLPAAELIIVVASLVKHSPVHQQKSLLFPPLPDLRQTAQSLPDHKISLGTPYREQIIML
jgi:hypothetical protein